jgi:hypothetical protein
VFYVGHMVLVDMVNKPHVSRRIGKWLLLFKKYDFTLVYNSSRTREIVDVLFTLHDTT